MEFLPIIFCPLIFGLLLINLGTLFPSELLIGELIVFILLSMASSWLPLAGTFGVLPFDNGAVIDVGKAALLLFECSNGEEYDRDRGPF